MGFFSSSVRQLCPNSLSSGRFHLRQKMEKRMSDAPPEWGRRDVSNPFRLPPLTGPSSSSSDTLIYFSQISLPWPITKKREREHPAGPKEMGISIRRKHYRIRRTGNMSARSTGKIDRLKDGIYHQIKTLDTTWTNRENVGRQMDIGATDSYSSSSCITNESRSNLTWRRTGRRDLTKYLSYPTKCLNPMMSPIWSIGDVIRAARDAMRRSSRCFKTRKTRDGPH